MATKNTDRLMTHFVGDTCQPPHPPMTTNAAAERLLDDVSGVTNDDKYYDYPAAIAMIRAALAAAKEQGYIEGANDCIEQNQIDETEIRRATVERIRKIALEVHHPDSWFIAQLDAEAKR